jgi:hypothetical protein
VKRRLVLNGVPKEAPRAEARKERADHKAKRRKEKNQRKRNN